MLDTLKRNKLLQECLNGSNGLFNKIKTSRKCSQSTSDVIDGQTEEIPQLFAKKYETLYISVEDEEELEKVLKEIKRNIQSGDSIEVDKITGTVVKEAATRLKGNKSDPAAAIYHQTILSTLHHKYMIISLLYFAAI